VPELPDIRVYLAALRPRVAGAALLRVRIRSPFLLRTFEPPPEAAEGKRVAEVFRVGKRIGFELEGGPVMVIHLMISGRFKWKEGEPGPWKPGRIDLCRFDFDTGTLTLTEAAKEKRASLHIFPDRAAARALHAGGIDVLSSAPVEFAAAMRRENRTLKRALTDPRIVDGIGNAYSDEILHAARMAPTKLISSMTDEELATLHAACRDTLESWSARLLAEFGLDSGGRGRFPPPGKITAFRPDFAVHGRFRLPCPVCGAPVQRIIRGDHETNYCPGCQTAGRILADRSLSRLLNEDWPRTLDELESA
jgi:formamidopyrimidine-DNA glycosylase